MADVKIPLLGKTLSEIQGIVHGLGMPGFTAKQIVAWLYDKKVFSIDDMTNLSLKNRERLKENYEIGATAPIHEMRSVDGTVKYLFCTPEGDYIESVYIPDEDRATLCVSSQVGCKMNCKFCMTGKQGYTNSLTPTQILNQIYSIPERDKLTNIVFMGMGEPFDNLDAVLRSLEILTADYGYAWSPNQSMFIFLTHYFSYIYWIVFFIQVIVKPVIQLSIKQCIELDFYRIMFSALLIVHMNTPISVIQ